MPTMPAQSLLTHLFSYDAESGRLFWKNPRSRTQRPGDEAGCEYQNGTKRYRIVNISKKLYLTHRIIWVMRYGRLGDDQIIDHVDQDGLNNRLPNLRIADKRLNSINAKMHSNNTSGCKGVTFDAAKRKWMAQMVVRGKRLHLGRFADINDAIAARRAAEAKYN